MPARQDTSPRAVFLAFFVAGAFAYVIAPSLVTPSSDVIQGVVFGAFFAGNALPMIWAAMGPGRLLARVSLCFLIVFVFVFSLVVGFVIAEGGPSSFKEFFQPFGVLPLIFLVFQIPFALMRMVTGWRIARTSSGQDERRHQGRQFGIAQLLVVTTFIAFALAMTRWSLSEEFGVIPWISMLMQLGIMLIWVSAVGPLCVWSAFRVRLLSVSAAIAAFHAGLLTLAIVVIVQILSSGSVGSEIIPFVACLHAATFVVLWSGLAMMRCLGYSLGPRQKWNDRSHRKGEASVDPVVCEWPGQSLAFLNHQTSSDRTSGPRSDKEKGLDGLAD